MDFPNLSSIVADSSLRLLKTIAPPDLCRTKQVIKLETYFAEWEEFEFIDVEDNSDNRYRTLHRSGCKVNRIHTAILSPDNEDQEGYVIVAKPFAPLDDARNSQVLIEYFPNDAKTKPLFSIASKHKSEDWSERLWKYIKCGALSKVKISRSSTTPPFQYDVFHIPQTFIDVIRKISRGKLAITIQLQAINTDNAITCYDSEPLSKFRPNGSMTDTTIQVQNGSENYEIHVARSVLATRTTFFHRVIMDMVNRSKTSDVPLNVIMLKNLSVDCVKDIIEYIYTNKLNLLKYDFAQTMELLKVIYMFELEELKRPALDRLAFTTVQLPDTVDILKLGEARQIPTLKQYAKHLMVSRKLQLDSKEVRDSLGFGSDRTVYDLVFHDD